MSVKSAQSHIPRGCGAVVKSGYLKKLKTSKRKYFVLRAAETCESSARLEYYDSEKKFHNGQLPKRSIPIKTCFNINKRHDIKHNKHVIALYTKDDCFCVILESEDESDAWLKALLAQQQGEEVPDGVMPRPTYEHTWQVQLLNRGISTMVPGYKTTSELMLTHRLCLTDKTLSLIKQEENNVIQTDFPLSLIRSCGCLKNYFYLEAGRSSVIGAGEIWMEAEDSHIASNIHQTVYNAMNSSGSREEFRNRSSSADEASKPKNMPRRQPINIGGPSKPMPSYQQGFPDLRIRSDSMPSRPRTSSEGNHPLMLIDRHWPSTGHPPLSRDISHSPPSDSPVSPPSVGCSTDSTGSSLSIDDSEGWHDGDVHRRFPISLTPDEAIAEENCDDCSESPCMLHSSPTPGSYIPMSHAPISSDDGYVDMSPRARLSAMSPAPSMSSVTSGTPSHTDIRNDYPLEKVLSYIPSEEDESSSNERQRTYSMGSKPFRNRIEQPRNRACSVGSKTKKGYNRVLPPHGYNHNGAKSNSAPLLINTRLYSSHSSIDPMEDLMEMDFTRKTTNDYVEMTPSNAPSAGAGHNQSAQSNKYKAPPGYVDMRPGAPMSIEKPEPSSYVVMKPGTSPSRPIQFESRSDYLEMDGRGNKMKPSTSPQNPSLSPLSSIASTSPMSQYTPTTDYMDMNFHQKNLDMYVASPVQSTLGYMSKGSPSSIDYIDMDYHPSSKKENEGYVEMSLGGGGNTPTAVGDYTNMSFGSSARKNQQNQEKSKNDSNTRSKPINIQQNSYGMILPIQPLLIKTRSWKVSRRDSKDSSSSSVTTPSSSSTIFPLSLNSPSSPVSSKSPDAKSPTITPTILKPPTTSTRIKVPSTVLNTKYQASGIRRDVSDYAPMNFSAPEKPSYVNFRPQAHPPSSKYPATSASSKAQDDYAPMDLGGRGSAWCESYLTQVNNSLCFKPIDEESNKQSRPSSESSEVSTLVGSRPNSVNSAGGQDPSSPAPAPQAQLHYASLDLASSDNAEDAALKRLPKISMKDGNGSNTQDAGFAYAEIDFARSEGFKANSLMSPKVKH